MLTLGIQPSSQKEARVVCEEAYLEKNRSPPTYNPR
jgi:hypothetical protein